MPTSEACRLQLQLMWTTADLGILWVVRPASCAARPTAEQHTPRGLAAEGTPIVAGLHAGPPRLHARHAATGAVRQRGLGSLQNDTQDSAGSSTVALESLQSCSLYCTSQGSVGWGLHTVTGSLN